MKKFIKILLYFILGVIAIFVIFMGTYIIVNWQGVIEPFQVGNPNAENKILIVSQGSEFKENLVQNLVERLKDDNNYLNVLDCTELDSEKVADWHAVLIIHSAQIHKMPKEAHLFLENATDLSNVILVSTSGSGDDKIEGFDVDAISTASRMAITPKLIEWIMPRIENMLINKVN